MAVQTTKSFPKHLWPGLFATFGTSYDEKTMQYSQIFTAETSDKSYEEIVEGTSYGLAAVKAEAASIIYDDREQTNSKRFTNVTTGLGAKISREAMEDNKYEAPAREAARLLGFSMRQTKEIMHANILNRGFNPAYTGADGKEFFATDHPTRSGDQSNELATPADLSEAALEDLLIQIRQTKNARGLRIELRGIQLVVPAAEMFNAQRILTTNLQSGTANNDVNAMRSMGMLPEGVMVYDYLTDSDAFFVKTNAPNGLMSFTRRAAKIEQDNEFDTENVCIKATERFVPGFADWRAMFASPGA
jgi:hypothetical protein